MTTKSQAKIRTLLTESLRTALIMGLALSMVSGGCHEKDRDDDDDERGFLPSRSMVTSSSEVTNTETEPTMSETDATAPSDTVPVEPVGENVTVAVPVAGATFQLPAGGTSYKATRKVHTFVSADGNMFLNVVTGVGYVPNVAQGTEGFLKDIVLENISDMPLFSHVFEVIGSNISLLSEGFTLAPNVFTDGEWFEPAYMRATLTGTMFDEYGGLVECPAFDSMYYAYNIPAIGTGVIFVVSTDPALGQDVKPVMEMIVATLSAYSEPLDAMNLEYTTFDC